MQHHTITAQSPVEITALDRLAAECRREIADHTEILRDYRLPIMRHHHREMRAQNYLVLRSLRGKFKTKGANYGY